MIADITDTYRLNSDAYGWHLQELRKRKSGPRWVSIKHYATLSQAIRGVCEYLIRIDAAAPADALKQIETVSEKIGHLVGELEKAGYPNA